MLPGRDILKDFWFCFCFFLSLPKLSLLAQHWQAAYRVLCVLDGSQRRDSPQRSLSVPLTMLSLSCGAPLLPGLPLSCLSQYQSGPISHDFPKSWCILDGLAHSWRAWQVSLGCLLAGGTSLAFAAVSLRPPLELCNLHTNGLSCSHLHFHASVECCRKILCYVLCWELAATLWQVHRGVKRVVGDTPVPPVLAFGAFMAWGVQQWGAVCDWDASLCPASVSALQLNTADVLPLISEMRLGG